MVECGECDGTGTVEHVREARLDELHDVQLQFLFEAYKTRENPDDNKEQLNPDPHGQMSGAGGGQMPSTGGSVPTYTPKHQR